MLLLFRKNGGGDASSPQAAKPKGKSNRKWVEDENVKLDFSNEKDASANSDTSQTELTSQYASVISHLVEFFSVFSFVFSVQFEC